MPSMLNPEEPPKIYPFEQLMITNFKLPPDVDRNTLEVTSSLLLTCDIIWVCNFEAIKKRDDAESKGQNKPNKTKQGNMNFEKVTESRFVPLEIAL